MMSVHNLHLIDVGPGATSTAAPACRHRCASSSDREALRAALADGTIDALVSDHTLVDEDARAAAVCRSRGGATALELLLSLAVRWAQADGVGMQRALATVTTARPVCWATALGTLSASAGLPRREGGVADLCILTPKLVDTPPSAAAQPGQTHPVHRPELPAVGAGHPWWADRWLTRLPPRGPPEPCVRWFASSGCLCMCCPACGPSAASLTAVCRPRSARRWCERGRNGMLQHLGIGFRCGQPPAGGPRCWW